MSKPITTQEAAENFTNACREFARVVRKAIFCSRYIHWRMKYDSGDPFDIGNAGTCNDCGHRQEDRITPPMPKVKPPRVDNSDLNALLIASTNPRYLKIGARYIGAGIWQGTINGVDSDHVSVEVSK